MSVVLYRVTVNRGVGELEVTMHATRRAAERFAQRVADISDIPVWVYRVELVTPSNPPTVEEAVAAVLGFTNGSGDDVLRLVASSRHVMDEKPKRFDTSPPPKLRA